MPRVKLGRTPEQAAAEAKERHDKLVLDVIRTQMAHKEVSRTELSEMTLISYKALGRILRGESEIDLWTAVRIANALSFSPQQRSALIGGRIDS